MWLGVAVGPIFLVGVMVLVGLLVVVLVVKVKLLGVGSVHVLIVGDLYPQLRPSPMVVGGHVFCVGAVDARGV
jgi:hypothetical protein